MAKSYDVVLVGEKKERMLVPGHFSKNGVLFPYRGRP